MKDKKLEIKWKSLMRELAPSLKPFGYIIKEILREYRDLDLLRGRRILELGPGDRFGLIDLLSGYTDVFSAGLTSTSVSYPAFHSEACLHDFLSSRKTSTIDLVYSREVMEEHTFEAPLLLESDAYKRLLTEGPSEEVWEEYPGSRQNILRCYAEISRILRPDGLVISQVKNRLAARFHDHRFELKNRLEKVVAVKTGILGHLWVYRKKP